MCKHWLVTYDHLDVLVMLNIKLRPLPHHIVIVSGGISMPIWRTNNLLCDVEFEVTLEIACHALKPLFWISWSNAFLRLYYQQEKRTTNKEIRKKEKPVFRRSGSRDDHLKLSSSKKGCGKCTTWEMLHFLEPEKYCIPILITQTKNLH